MLKISKWHSNRYACVHLCNQAVLDQPSSAVLLISDRFTLQFSAAHLCPVLLIWDSVMLFGGPLSVFLEGSYLFV